MIKWKLLLSLFSLLALCGAPLMAVELSGGAAPNAAVPGNCGWGCGTPLTSTIVIPAGITSINDIRCSVNIQGTGGFSSVVPELTSPSGQTVTLSNFNCPGTSSQPIINVTFGQSPNAFSAANLNAGWSFVMDSCFPPGPSMDVFDGLDATGVWTLSVYREFQSPTATLVEWELIVSDSQIGQVPVPANDACADAILIDDLSVTPFDMTSATASGVADCLGATGLDIWYELTAPCAGNYSFFTVNTSFANVVTAYAGTSCPVPGSPALACAAGQVTVGLAEGESVYVKVAPDAGATAGAGEIGVISDTQPANDDCGSPELLVAATGTVGFDTTCATEGFTQTCSAGPASMFPLIDVWYLFTADCDGDLVLDTFGSSFDTAIAAWPASACPTGPAPFCNDQAPNPPPGENSRSELTIPGVLAGEQFLIQVGGGVLGASGAGVLNVTWDCDMSGPIFLRGDANNDAGVNIADAIFALQFLFPPAGQPAVMPQCFDSCDGNDDGDINIADAIFILNVLFPGAGPVTVFPLPTGVCGIDPTVDVLDCVAYDAVSCP